MRTTLTLDDALAHQIEQENRRAGEPMKQTMNRLLRLGLHATTNPARIKRFVVKPLDTGITRDQWKEWEGRKIEDILEEAESRVAQ